MTVQIDEDLAPPWVLDGADHPLSRLSADEIRTARVIMAEAGLVSVTSRFPILALDEPRRTACSPSPQGIRSCDECAPWCSTLQQVKRNEFAFP